MSRAGRWRTISRLLIGAVILVALVAAGLATTIARQTAAPAPKLVGGTVLQRAAPAFSLPDQNGRTVSLAGERGHVLVVTFFYTHCPDTCPMTAQKLRTVIRALGREQRRVQVLIVTTDPLRDDPADARAFLRRHGMPSWHFLLGPYARVRGVWSAFHVYAAPPGQVATLGQMHTAGMFLIDPRSRERLYLSDSVPAVQIATDLHVLLHDGMAGAAVPIAPQVGGRAPAFSLQTLSGSSVSLADLRGRPALINFWATWCVPCRAEMPLLERTYRADGKRLRILGIDEQEPASQVRDFARGLHVRYPIALDASGDVQYVYQIYGMPSTFLLDRHGVIRQIQRGAYTTRSLAKALRRVL